MSERSFSGRVGVGAATVPAAENVMVQSLTLTTRIRF